MEIACLTRRPAPYSAGGRSRDPRGCPLPVARGQGSAAFRDTHPSRAASGAAAPLHDVRPVLGTASLDGAGMGGVYAGVEGRG